MAINLSCRATGFGSWRICWVPEHANSGTSCLTLKSKVGETVQLETLKVLQDVLVYRPSTPNNEPQEMLRIASASAE